MTRQMLPARRPAIEGAWYGDWDPPELDLADLL